MASLIADKFRDSDGLQLSSLLAVGFVLFAITLVVNAIARWLVWQVQRRGRVA
jgi:phosphate transport system permease protein